MPECIRCRMSTSLMGNARSKIPNTVKCGNVCQSANHFQFAGQQLPHWLFKCRWWNAHWMTTAVQVSAFPDWHADLSGVPNVWLNDSVLCPFEKKIPKGQLEPDPFTFPSRIQIFLPQKLFPTHKISTIFFLELWALCVMYLFLR